MTGSDEPGGVTTMAGAPHASDAHTMDASGSAPSCCSGESMVGFDEWAAEMRRSFVPMTVRALPGSRAETFRASIKRTLLGELSISLIKADGNVADRDALTVLKQPASYYKISHQLTGSASISQEGRTAVLGPGDYVLYDTDRPFRVGAAGHGHSLVMQIPHGHLPVSPSQIESLLAVTVGSARFLPGLGALLQAIAEDGPESSLGSAVRAAAGLSQLLGAGFSFRRPGDGENARELLFSVIDRYIIAHLSNPDLSLGDVARAAFVSERQIQRIFEARETTFGRWLRDRRLAHAHEQLCSSTAPISLIAAESGFVSAAHFSRAFRERYGTSARELRSRTAASGSS